MFSRSLFDRRTGATRAVYLSQKRMRDLAALEERARVNAPADWRLWRALLNRAARLHRHACRLRVVPMWILHALDTIEGELKRAAHKETA
jgi:hypothetical protein